MLQKLKYNFQSKGEIAGPPVDIITIEFICTASTVYKKKKIDIRFSF